jgi:hypothetical protein
MEKEKLNDVLRLRRLPDFAQKRVRNEWGAGNTFLIRIDGEIHHFADWTRRMVQAQNDAAATACAKGTA